MDKSVEFYVNRGIAPSTARSYGSARKRYNNYCLQQGAVAIPTTEGLLCRFAAFLAKEGLAPTTIRGYLSAVAHWQLLSDRGDPGIHLMKRLGLVMRGIKREAAKSSHRREKKLPITAEVMKKLKGAWAKGGNPDAVMLWAAASLAFFAFLRAGELTIPTEKGFEKGVHLECRDITPDSWEHPSRLKVTIKASKTDPFRRGVDLFVGRTGGELCPVAAVLAYMVARGPGPGPMFKLASGRPLTRARFTSEVRAALRSAGVDPERYSGHSFRSGAATTAAEKGLNHSYIQQLGRWTSGCYHLYVRTPREKLASISELLAGTSGSK